VKIVQAGKSSFISARDGTDEFGVRVLRMLGCGGQRKFSQGKSVEQFSVLSFQLSAQTNGFQF